MLVIVGLAAAQTVRASDTLADSFLRPPQEARPMIWWHWLNGNVSRDGIEKDLQAMKAAGIGGFHLFDVSMCAPGPVRYGSPEWIDLRGRALQRAQELGLKTGLHVGPGWSEAAGPWIKPEDSMKFLVWTETIVDGQNVDRVLAEPRRIEGVYKDVAVMAVPCSAEELTDLAQARATAQLEDGHVDASALVDDNDSTAYELPKPSPTAPVAIRLTFPEPITVNALECLLPLSRWGLVARATLEGSADGKTFSLIREFRILPGSGLPPVTAVNFKTVTAQIFRLTVFEPTDNILPTCIAEIRFRSSARLEDWAVLSGRTTVGPGTQKANPDARDIHGSPLDAVVDLTDKMDAGGRLRWSAPNGKWIVYRFGYTSTGERNHPAQPEATGLEVDKMDPVAVKNYIEQSIGRELALPGQPVRMVLADSWEAGAQNWSVDFQNDFKSSAGYDIRRWLPVLTGRVIGTTEDSKAFLWDFRQAISHAVSSSFFGTLRRELNARGVTFYGEPYGGPFEMGQAGEPCEVPMSEFWITEKEFGNLKNISSLAHAAGEPLVAAESFTAMKDDANYRLAPADYKTVGDRAFSKGLNQVFLHSFVHQPSEAAPGFSLGFFGSHFNRHESWWPMVRGWTDYLARCQLLLRHGVSVADVAYLRKEESPGESSRWDYGTAGMPKAYDYDYISSTDLMSATVVNGQLVLRSGVKYRVLVLPDRPTMRAAIAVKLQDLVKSGLQLLGPAPAATPGLAGRDLGDRQLAAVRAELWGDLDGSSQTGRRVGQGQVIVGREIDQVLSDAGVPADFQHSASTGEIVYCHRATEDRDVYFVANVDADRAAAFTATFRAQAKSVTLWDAVTGAVRSVDVATSNGSSAIPLKLAARESVFVVFSRNSAPMALPETKQTRQASLTGPWQIELKSLGRSRSIEQVRELNSLSRNSDAEIRHFGGGVASYRTQFTVAPGSWQPGRSASLELGRVADVAQVRVNGKDCGIAWVNPYRVQVDQALRIGDNELEVIVAVPWANRLIADAKLPDGPRYDGEGDLAQVPDWVAKEDRALPDKQRRSFTTFQYYKGGEALIDTGLLGPVSLLLQEDSVSQTK